MPAVQDSIDSVRIAAAAADRMKGEDIIAFDVTEPLAITDIFLIITGDNPRQVLSIAEEVEKQMHLQKGISPREREGVSEGQWILQDYGDFVVHIMDRESREFYDLDRLWKECPRIGLGLPEHAGDGQKGVVGAADDDTHDEAASAGDGRPAEGALG